MGHQNEKLRRQPETDKLGFANASHEPMNTAYESGWESKSWPQMGRKDMFRSERILVSTKRTATIHHRVESALPLTTVQALASRGSALV